MHAWGWWLVVIGIIVATVGLFFDTSYGDVNNLGLIADRIVIVLIGGIITLSGVILLAAGALKFAILFPDQARPKPQPSDDAAAARPDGVKPGYTVGPGQG